MKTYESWLDRFRYKYEYEIGDYVKTALKSWSNDTIYAEIIGKKKESSEGMDNQKHYFEKYDIKLLNGEIKEIYQTYIVRKLTEEEIKQYKMEQESDKYNL